VLIECSCFVDRAVADELSDALMDCGAVSVQAEDADADSPDEQPIFGEPGQPSLPPAVFGWHKTRLILMFEVDAGMSAVMQFARANELLLNAASQCTKIEMLLEASRVQQVDEKDWVRLTQQQFDPIIVGDKLAISPSWHLSHPAVQGRIVVELDPGLAFGTGSHPTTHLCLQWLEQFANHKDAATMTAIDYGCGSGILAIAASKLGISRLVSPIVALDIDPQAVLSSIDNAARNSVTLNVAETSTRAPAPADLVIANILSNPLKVLAPLLCSLVKPGGALILSGVLERQIDEVSAAYAPYMAIRAWRVQEGWACLEGFK
jgi:ribosomal protein L11 methyltransferase